jgi:hypothetical protein
VTPTSALTAPARRTSHTRLAVLGLLAVTAAWGSTFYLLKGVVERVPVTDFLAVRFAIAAVAVWLLAPRSLSRLTAAERRSGIALGVVYGGAQVLQTVGLQSTSASVSGFVTGMYVCSPRCSVPTCCGPASDRPSGPPSRWPRSASRAVAAGPGGRHRRGAHLASAVLYAAHIVGLGVWSTSRNALGLTVVQLLTITVVCGVGAVPAGSPCRRRPATGRRSSTWPSSPERSPSSCRPGRRRTCRRRAPPSS